MPEIPKLLPEKGKFRALFTWLNQLRAVVKSLQPGISHNTLTESGGDVVFRQGLPRTEAAPGAPGCNPRGRWVATTSYEINDLVYVDGTPDWDLTPGPFICVQAITGDIGNPEPVEDGTHWELYGISTWTRLSIGAGTVEIQGFPYTEKPKVVITGPDMGAGGGSYIRNDTEVLCAIAGMMNYDLKPRLLIFSNGTDRFQCIVMSTEPQAYP